MGAFGTLTIDSREEAFRLLTNWGASYDTDLSNVVMSIVP